MAQRVMIFHVFVAGRNSEDTLGEQLFQRMIDLIRIAQVLEACCELPDQA